MQLKGNISKTMKINPSTSTATKNKKIKSAKPNKRQIKKMKMKPWTSTDTKRKKKQFKKSKMIYFRRFPPFKTGKVN